MTANLTAMTILHEHFDNLAKGNIQVPRILPRSMNGTFFKEKDLVIFHDYLLANSGSLFKHFLASIPNIIEELSRIGNAISKSTNIKSLWEIEAFDASFSRAINFVCKDSLQALSNSPNPANRAAYERYTKPQHTRYLSCSFFETEKHLRTSRLGHPAKFDFIYEMAGFQFYGADRSTHISLLKNYLNDSGIAIFLEKLKDDNESLFQEKEDVKDWQYKTRFFTREEILWKRKNMLEDMHSGLISVNEMSSLLSKNFNNVAIIWNGTNFYEFLVTNDSYVFKEFLEELGPSIIEKPFEYVKPIIIKEGIRNV